MDLKWKFPIPTPNNGYLRATITDRQNKSCRAPADPVTSPPNIDASLPPYSAGAKIMKVRTTRKEITITAGRFLRPNFRARTMAEAIKPRKPARENVQITANTISAIAIAYITFLKLPDRQRNRPTVKGIIVTR